MDNSNVEYTSNTKSQISTWYYASEAINEIKNLLKAVNNPTNTKLVFQSLPKHMRRRAASHHPKRLPRKYRIAHVAQMLKSGRPQATKRPSRKYRRRVTKLLQEYLRRQRRHTWLETHIWHARRFHMINRWGYRLPYASCNKSYKASYRASANHCLLQDISFHACIELHGTLEKLKDGFKRMTSKKVGLGITAKTYISGKREGSIDLFMDGQYPDGALGRVTFIWCAEKKCNPEIRLQNQRILWIWIHPSCYLKILEEFLKVFQLISRKNVSVNLNTQLETYNSGDDLLTHNLKMNNSSTTKKNKGIQFMTRTLGYTRIKHYVNTKESIDLFELKDTLNRYRLTGPLSQSVLALAFQPKSFTLNNCNNNTGDWFQKLLNKSEENRIIHNAQSSFWKQCSLLQSPVELMSNMVIGLNISDPYLHRPQIRTKALVQSSNIVETINRLEIVKNIPENLHESEIWSAKLRNDIKKNILTINAYSQLRAKYAVATGMSSTFEDTLQTVPILLIQRPGSVENGYGCGWDIISPGGYGMSIWSSLIAWGARPGGLREFDLISQESLNEQYLPDTVSGLQLATEHHFEKYNRYFRLPPNKRCNYSKLAIVSPFRIPYMELVRDWLPEKYKLLGKERFHILRDRTILEKLTNCLNERNIFFPEISPQALIQIQLCMKNRGKMSPFSIICVPKRIDLKCNFKKILNEDNRPVFTESVQFDCNAKERKLTRLQHKRLLKRLRAKRVRRKRKLQESSKNVVIEPAYTKPLIAAQFKKMCTLWLPKYRCNVLNSVRKQCSREVFGYVNIGGFNNTKSTVCGIGYVIADGLKELIKLCNILNIKSPMCLVRSPNTRNYRFASLKINLEV